MDFVTWIGRPPSLNCLTQEDIDPLDTPKVLPASRYVSSPSTTFFATIDIYYRGSDSGLKSYKPIIENGRRYYNEVLLNPNSGGLRLPRMAAFSGGPRNLFANEDFSLISYANKQIRPSSELPLQNIWIKVRRFELTTSEMGDNTFVDFPSRMAYSDVSTELRKQSLFDADPIFHRVIPLDNRRWQATWHSLGQHLVFDSTTTSLVLIDSN